MCPWSGEWWNSRGGTPTAIKGKVVGYVKFGRPVCSANGCVTMNLLSRLRDVSLNSSVSIVTG